MFLFVFGPLLAGKSPLKAPLGNFVSKNLKFPPKIFQKKIKKLIFQQFWGDQGCWCSQPSLKVLLLDTFSHPSPSRIVWKSFFSISNIKRKAIIELPRKKKDFASHFEIILEILWSVWQKSCLNWRKKWILAILGGRLVNSCIRELLRAQFWGNSKLKGQKRQNGRLFWACGLRNEGK